MRETPRRLRPSRQGSVGDPTGRSSGPGRKPGATTGMRVLPGLNELKDFVRPFLGANFSDAGRPPVTRGGPGCGPAFPPVADGPLRIPEGLPGSAILPFCNTSSSISPRRVKLMTGCFLLHRPMARRPTLTGRSAARGISTGVTSRGTPGRAFQGGQPIVSQVEGRVEIPIHLQPARLAP
jgi:hypothetical protein